MPNTFRNKQVEEGLDESVRTRHTRRQPQIPRDEPTDAPQQEPCEEPSKKSQEEPREEPQEESKKEPQPSKPRTKSGALLSNLLSGEVLNKQWFRNQRLLLLLIAAFCIILVTNRYYVEHLTKDKLATEERIKFLREERIQMKKDYQESVKISHIASQLDSLGVGLIAGPPYELTVSDKRNKHRD